MGMSTEAVALSQWESFGNVPVDDEGLTLEDWQGFKAGTSRESVWHWFEVRYGVSVADLMGQ